MEGVLTSSLLRKKSTPGAGRTEENPDLSLDKEEILT
jgi:hypothetical protein